MKRVGWVTDPRFLDHAQSGHAERPERLARLLEFMHDTELDRKLTPVPHAPVDASLLARIHAPSQIELVRTMSENGGQIDADTYVVPGSYEIALAAAGAVVDTARAVWSGTVDRAFAAIRPPGHHATEAISMGFCLFNNVALAAEALLDEGAKRIFVFDWDVHHGNGTQDIFYARDDVLFCSLHQAGIYPGTGAPDEIGVDAGTGHTLNLPLPAGAGDDAYEQCFVEVIEPVVRRFDPDMILLSAGYDAHSRDPLAALELSVTGFHRMARRLTSLADAVCDGRLAACLEGGYDADALAWSAQATIAAMADETPAEDPWPGSEVTPPDIAPLLEAVRAIHGL